MATVSAMMATAGTSSLIIQSRSSPLSLSGAGHVSQFGSKRVVTVRCDASKPDSGSESSVSPVPTNPSVTPISTPAPKAAPAVAPKPKVSTSFGDVFAFSGPAPETINGRLAMLGFVAALGAELATGESLQTQLGDGGVAAFVFAGILFTTASLIPLFKGVTAESKSKGFFSSTAEVWNGRAAMIGLVALAITEFVNGSPLV